MMKAADMRPVKLTRDQIEEVLDIIRFRAPIKSLTTSVKQDIKDGIVEVLKSQLVDIELVPTPQAFAKFKDEIYKRFCKASVEFGSPVGIWASEAISAPVTQTSLNSFHQSGSIKNVSYGIGGMIEIFNISKSRKHVFTTVHYADKSLSFDQVLETRQTLDGVMVGDLVTDFVIEEVERLDKENAYPTWFDDYVEINDLTDDDFIHQSGWYMKLMLNVPMMYSYRITMDKVVEAITFRDRIITCVPSPLFEGTIYIFVSDEKILQRTPSRGEKFTLSTTSDIGRENIGFTYLNVAVLNGIKEMLISGIKGIKRLFPQEIPIISMIDSEIKASTVYPNDPRGFVRPDVPDIDNLWFVVLNRYRTHINGIKKSNVEDIFKACGIEILPTTESSHLLLVRSPNGKPTEVAGKAVSSAQSKLLSFYKDRKTTNAELYRDFKPQLSEQPDTPELIQAQEIVRKGTYVFSAVEGSNLRDLIRRDDLDGTRVVCNDFYEFYDVLGIEATRNLIIKEIRDVVLADEYINYRHISLLAEFMTNRGTLLPVTPSGINRQSIPAWTKVTVEKAVDTFASASGFGSVSKPNSVSTSIMFGQRALIGTGSQIELIDTDDLDSAFEQAMESGSLELGSGLETVTDITVVTDTHEFAFRKQSSDDSAESVGTTQRNYSKHPLDEEIPFGAPRYDPEKAIKITPTPTLSKMTMDVMKGVEYKGTVNTKNDGRNKIYVTDMPEKINELKVSRGIEEPSKRPKIFECKRTPPTQRRMYRWSEIQPNPERYEESRPPRPELLAKPKGTYIISFRKDRLLTEYLEQDLSKLGLNAYDREKEGKYPKFADVIWTGKSERNAWDKELYSVTSTVKNLLQHDQMKSIANKMNLYQNLLMENPEFTLVHMARTVPLITYKPNVNPDGTLDTVQILRRTDEWSGSGRDVMTVSTLKDLDEAKDTVYKSNLQEIITSDYILKPLLIRNRKFHIRVALIYVPRFEGYGPIWDTWGIRRCFTGDSEYKAGDFSNKEIHDSHAKSTKGDIFWGAPRPEDGITQEMANSVDLQIDYIGMQVAKICDHLRPYKESKYGFTIFGMDIMMDMSSGEPKAILIECNGNNVGFGINKQDSIYSPASNMYSKNYFDWIYNTAIEPLMKLSRGDSAPIKAVVQEVKERERCLTDEYRKLRFDRPKEKEIKELQTIWETKPKMIPELPEIKEKAIVVEKPVKEVPKVFELKSKESEDMKKLSIGVVGLEPSVGGIRRPAKKVEVPVIVPEEVKVPVIVKEEVKMEPSGLGVVGLEPSVGGIRRPAKKVEVPVIVPEEVKEEVPKRRKLPEMNVMEFFKTM